MVFIDLVSDLYYFSALNQCIMKGFNTFFTVVILLLYTGLEAQNTIADGQDEVSQHPWSVSFSGGTSVFFGDVKQNPILPTLINKSELRYVTALGLERRLSNNFSLRAELAYSHVVGTHRAWNRHFQSFVYEGNLALMFYPVNAIWGYNPNRIANLYLLAGTGMVNYNSTLYALDFGQVIRQNGYGNGSGINGMTIGVVAVGGLGIDFPLSDRFDFKLEISQHMLFNDELDLVASGFKYDMYNQISVGFKYHFGRKKSADSDMPDSIFQKPEPLIQEKVEPEVDDQWQSINQVIEVGETKTEPEIIPEIVVEEVPEIVKEIAPEPEVPVVKDKEYRVQILNNGRRQMDINQLAGRFNLDAADITASVYNGMHIYTVGGFDTYEEAATYRETVKSVHGVHDAFIVPFVKGKRVAKMP